MILTVYTGYPGPLNVVGAYQWSKSGYRRSLRQVDVLRWRRECSMNTRALFVVVSISSIAAYDDGCSCHNVADIDEAHIK